MNNTTGVINDQTGHKATLKLGIKEEGFREVHTVEKPGTEVNHSTRNEVQTT